MRLKLTIAVVFVLAFSSPGLAFNWSHPFSGGRQNPELRLVEVRNYKAGIGLTSWFAGMSSGVRLNGSELSYQEDLGLDRNVTIMELSGEIRAGLSLKGCYLFPKTINGAGFVPASSEASARDRDKPLSVTSSWTLTAGRIELGCPLAINNALSIEPQFVWQWISPKLEISGQDYSLSRSARLSQGGIGIEATEVINNYSFLKAKYVLTTDSSLFQLKYLLNQKIGSLAAGWMWWKFDIDRSTTRISGPFIEVWLGF